MRHRLVCFTCHLNVNPPYKHTPVFFNLETCFQINLSPCFSASYYDSAIKKFPLDIYRTFSRVFFKQIAWALKLISCTRCRSFGSFHVQINAAATFFLSWLTFWLKSSISGSLLSRKEPCVNVENYDYGTPTETVWLEHKLI